MTQLRVSPTLALPLDAATESFGILGQRGAGKSNVEVVFAEELWKVRIPWVAIDPKGDWHGIRSSADGRGPGLPIPVIGGLHGDVPLEAASGSYVADLLIDQELTAVLDVSQFSQADLARFLIAFCHRLFARHQADPHVRVVIFEEAHRYIPQSVTGATAALKDGDALEKFCRVWRQRRPSYRHPSPLSESERGGEPTRISATDFAGFSA